MDDREKQVNELYERLKKQAADKETVVVSIPLDELRDIIWDTLSEFEGTIQKSYKFHQVENTDMDPLYAATGDIMWLYSELSYQAANQIRFYNQMREAFPDFYETKPSPTLAKENIQKLRDILKRPE